MGDIFNFYRKNFKVMGMFYFHLLVILLANHPDEKLSLWKLIYSIINSRGNILVIQYLQI